MPRGKYVNHKGRSRNFASAEELEEKHKKKELKKANRDPEADTDEESDEESSEEETKSGSGSESEEESSSEDENKKKKGVSGLIEIENPNHRRKTTQKVTKVDVSAAGSSKPELSRREREELDKQRAAANYQKMHAEGKTEQARADLARLAIIKQHRAEAAARRDAEKKEKDDKAKKAAAK